MHSSSPVAVPSLHRGAENDESRAGASCDRSSKSRGDLFTGMKMSFYNNLLVDVCMYLHVHVRVHVHVQVYMLDIILEQVVWVHNYTGPNNR